MVRTSSRTAAHCLRRLFGSLTIVCAIAAMFASSAHCATITGTVNGVDYQDAATGAYTDIVVLTVIP
ncbi:MAG: hypothetical protein AABY45_08135 [Deltaproteobacteria bacterium]